MCREPSGAQSNPHSDAPPRAPLSMWPPPTSEHSNLHHAKSSARRCTCAARLVAGSTCMRSCLSRSSRRQSALRNSSQHMSPSRRGGRNSRLPWRCTLSHRIAAAARAAVRAATAAEGGRGVVRAAAA
eukprot:CAMPEP_0181171478 /NCGR_PEP_ID=MMETSP1096-20121128/1930_1 /TAXON_ID=156174 ORGANISM="Chrysochromulina ericina, Strain CCMP281" /NCGR_SAMPLE_ID=MMETSP1096 /ASSEMBLY_ACC=CAM_ASM_000453 /LENGTH=127 /DNA_ID=CAMNT_0023259127 /DNA_START=56 /DNA_END=436 /DNA_ORIENTATION=+